MAFFVVTTVHDANWDRSRGIREQDGWEAHAEFMDGLVDDGFVILGGPIGDGERAMLVIEATGEDEIHARMADDPWAPTGTLRIGQIERWSLWLDGRNAGRTRARTPGSD